LGRSPVLAPAGRVADIAGADVSVARTGGSGRQQTAAHRAASAIGVDPRLAVLQGGDHAVPALAQGKKNAGRGVEKERVPRETREGASPRLPCAPATGP